MHSLIVVVAKYALFVVALGAVVSWLLVSRREKVVLAAQTIGAILLVVVLVKIAAAVHTDPRPFVVDPTVTPFFAHSADNGFPSDHTALATAVATLVTWYRRRIGIVLLVLSALIGAARVAAHVHHWQDIIAGLVIGLVAAAIPLLAWNRWDTSNSARSVARRR